MVDGIETAESVLFISLIGKSSGIMSHSRIPRAVPNTGELSELSELSEILVTGNYLYRGHIHVGLQGQKNNFQFNTCS